MNILETFSDSIAFPLYVTLSYSMPCPSSTYTSAEITTPFHELVVPRLFLAIYSE